MEENTQKPNSNASQDDYSLSEDSSNDSDDDIFTFSNTELIFPPQSKSNTDLIFPTQSKSNTDLIFPTQSKSNEDPITQSINKIPHYQYKSHRIRTKLFQKNGQVIDLIPLNPLDTNSNKFFNQNDAFIYIGKHCQKYYGKFTKDLCEAHLKDCYFYDLRKNKFVSFKKLNKDLSQKQFNRHFYQTQRLLKYLFGS